MPYDEYPDERGFRYLAAFVYSIVVAVFWIPVFVARCVIRFFQEAGTESWPLADGTITCGDVKVIHGWLLDFALGRLDYCYKVHGEYYSGHCVRQFADEQSAWDFVDSRRNMAALIRYKDDNHTTSILRELDQKAFPSERSAPGIGTQVWQHWRDELRIEPSDQIVDLASDAEIDTTDASTLEADKIADENASPSK